ncbi:hypothetical protein PFLUV_G00185790 [Perca fluviatilis]|uniref:Uncharacterized protein n=1 Tax=Perca fluviatilis TaxID=8168 RepID=A0A6A5EB65_PERFL|nr:hypothetical protein PFLUV_G00185790 [Perca fluviatilis]
MAPWFGNLSTQSKSKLQRLVQTAMKVMGRTDERSLQRSLQSIYGAGTVLMMSLCDMVRNVRVPAVPQEDGALPLLPALLRRGLRARRHTTLCCAKNLVKRMNQGSDRDIYTHGRVTLPGFRKLNCTQAAGGLPKH